jgi:adenylate kinase family enzyme
VPTSAADLQRVVIIGMSGAGKSTAARRLAAMLDLPHVELDALYWGPAWTSRPDFRERVQLAVQGDRWVVDGNYGSARDLAWPRATAIVWLNLPFARVFWRVLCRTLRRSWRREVLWSGNRESLARSFFSRDSILWWVLTMYHRRRREVAARRGACASGVAWIELRTARAVNDWLRALEGTRAAWSQVPQA